MQIKCLKQRIHTMLSSHGGIGNEEGVKVGENEATDQRKLTVKHSGKTTVRTGLDTKEGFGQIPWRNFYLSFSINHTNKKT